MKIIEDIKEFTVNRKKWHRGKGCDTSCLLNPTSGKMCCLGFYALQSGLSKKNIEKMPTPNAVRQRLNGEDVYSSMSFDCISEPAKPIKWKTKLISGKSNSATCGHLMEVNDNKDISDEVREKKITSLFKRIGIAVKFVG